MQGHTSCPHSPRVGVPDLFGNLMKTRKRSSQKSSSGHRIVRTVPEGSHPPPGCLLSPGSGLPSALTVQAQQVTAVPGAAAGILDRRAQEPPRDSTWAGRSSGRHQTPLNKAECLPARKPSAKVTGSKQSARDEGGQKWGQQRQLSAPRAMGAARFPGVRPPSSLPHLLLSIRSHRRNHVVTGTVTFPTIPRLSGGMRAQFWSNG